MNKFKIKKNGLSFKLSRPIHGSRPSPRGAGRAARRPGASLGHASTPHTLMKAFRMEYDTLTNCITLYFLYLHV